jgi:hypothetical protein
MPARGTLQPFRSSEDLFFEMGARLNLRQPAAAQRARRLENQWYAVLFYTDSYWGQGNCT